MRKDGGNMKTFIKKYYMPLILAIISVVFVGLFRIMQNVPFIKTEISVLVFTFASVLAIRAIDDLLDYKKDVEDNKKVIPLKVQIPIISVLGIIILVSSFICYPFVGPALGLLFLLIVFYAHRSNNILKLFILPILFMISFIMIFNIYSGLFVLYTSYAYMGLVIMISIVGAIAYGLLKKGKK